jgi:3-methyladenine DNA glycosylase AlkD
MANDILTRVRTKLVELADDETRSSGQRYFKEEIKLYGVKSNLVSKLAASFGPELKTLTKKEVFDLCEELFKADYSEEAYLACDWVYSRHQEYRPADFGVFENWIRRYINNWAKCDTLCNHSLAAFIDLYPEHLQNLKEWARSENRWVKRASAVTLIIPAREGRYLADIFEIAEILLTDPDDMVQKGYGWMLKAASQAHQKEVFDYVMRHKAQMPRTALRYAIEKMPADLKKPAMQK